MTRPLTSRELSRLAAACRKVENTQRAADDARHELNLVIHETFQARGSVTEIAEAVGFTRTTIYEILKQFEDERPI